MIRKTIIILSALMLFGVLHDAHAQTLNDLLKRQKNKTTRKVEEKVEKKVDEKVDEEVDKAVDKLFRNLFEEEKKETPKNPEEKKEINSEAQEAIPDAQQNINNAMSGLLKSMGVGVDIPHKERYDFTANIKMKIEAVDEMGNQQPEAFYNTFFNESDADYAIEFTNEEDEMAYFIFDAENSVTLIMAQSEDNKTGIATKLSEESLDEMMGEAYEDAAEQANLNLKKTGKTKTVGGYKCDEYRYEDDESITFLYVTKALKKKLNKVYKSSIFTGLIAMPGYVDGVVVQYDTKSKIDKSSSVLTIVDVDMGKKSKISTEGYQFIGIAAPMGE